MLPITKETVMAAYEYSRTTPPFRAWKLPPAEVVKWHISKSIQHFAQYWWDGEHHHIEVSSRGIGSTSILIEKVHHEIIHLHLKMIKKESKNGGPNVHNKHYRRKAARVCLIHGWDVKAFY